jgi:hypothetical protein
MPRIKSSHAVEARLAFTRTEDVSVAAEGRGGLRAKTLSAHAMADPRSYDQRLCKLIDGSNTPDFCPDLRVHGFAHADLSRLPELQAALARVRVAGHLSDVDAAQIRRRLQRRSLPLSGGARLRLLHIAREGFFMRRAGPNGRRVDDAGPRTGHNGHDAATAVHADQDVDGTPLRQILRGTAPLLFHHDSPDRSNHRSRLFLINLWIPLDQVTRPLALMDKRTLDRRAHQLRYGLPTDTFLQRSKDMQVNDIWTFLHDDRQQWYFGSEMDSNTAYVFETLGSPHGSFIIPGEELADLRRQQLVDALDAVKRRDEAAATRALTDPGEDPRPEPATPSLRRAITAMEALIAEGRAHTSELCRAEGPTPWSTRATAAADHVVRKSLEMRVVALLTTP